MGPRSRTRKSVALTRPSISIMEVVLLYSVPFPFFETHWLQMIDNARKGSFGHLASLASYASNEDSIPENLHKSIFDLAANYIMKPFPPEGDYSSHVLRQASSIRDVILNEDLASFLLDSMSVFLDATYRSLDDRYDSLMLCIRMISSVYSITSSAASYISHGFQHGLVDIFLKIGQIYNSIDKGDRMPISNMLRRRIPAFMLLKSVLQATRQDMTTVSGKLDHEPLHTSLLRGDFKGIWRDFEIVILEHSILRRVHALAIQRDHVYCSNVSLSMCPPLST